MLYSFAEYRMEIVYILYHDKTERIILFAAGFLVALAIMVYIIYCL